MPAISDRILKTPAVDFPHRDPNRVRFSEAEHIKHSRWHVIGKTIGNRINMLRWTLTFLIIALIAAVFGFTGIAAGAAEIAKIIFYIFLVFFVISLIAGAFRRVD